MGQPNWLALALFLLSAAPPFAASKDAGQPDREMLRMMEFLGEIEMLKQMELIREMREVEHPRGNLPPQKSPPGPKRDPTK